MTEEEPPTATPWISVRVLVIALFMLASFGALGAKLYVEQVTRTSQWAAKVRKSSSVTVRIPSVRGEIRDRNNIVLVDNKTSYGIDFYLPEIVRDYREKHKKDGVPRLTYRANIDNMPKDVAVEDVVQIVNSAVIPNLNKLEIAQDYNAHNLDKHFRSNAEVPFNYLDSVDFETVARLSANDDDMPGVDVALRPVREYKYGAFAAHLLGFVGPPEDVNKEPDIDEFKYYEPDVVGRQGVEKFCDVYLRGKPGRRVLERTPKGRIGAEIERIAPTPGNNVCLTIDARIQMIAENVLREAGVGRGAAVVVDPNNGDVLAMVSVPSYDPNIFIPKISKADQAALSEDLTNPGVNRCVLGYLPGSTFKTVTSLAGLHYGIDPMHKWVCNGFVAYGNRPMRCWIGQQGGQHGALDLEGGLKNSCNCYFFQMANSMMDPDLPPSMNKVGLQQIELIGDALGLGKRSGLPISGEEPGILPGPRYLTAHGKAAMIQSSGNIANTSIGQGMVEASPLQMAMVCATLANRGINYQPRLVHRVVDDNDQDVRGDDGELLVPKEPRIRANLRDLGLTPDKIEYVRKGMWKVVNEERGTGTKGRIKGVENAGKTGTAQFKHMVNVGGHEKLEPDNRVWFMCFAPYQAPKYVVVVMIEGAKSGGGVAAPVATKIMREALELDAGNVPTLAPLAKVDGRVEKINEIKVLPDGGLVKILDTTAGGGDSRPVEDASTQTEEEIPVEARKNKSMHADVRAAADERGTVVPPPAKRGNFFQRIFGPRQPKSQPTPASGHGH